MRVKCEHCNGTGAVKEEGHEDRTDLSPFEKLHGTECPKCGGLGYIDE